MKHKEKDRDKEKPSKQAKAEGGKLQLDDKLSKKQLISPDLSTITGGLTGSMGNVSKGQFSLDASAIQQASGQISSQYAAHNPHGPQTVVVPPLQSTMMATNMSRSSASRGMSRTDIVDLKGMQMSNQYPSAKRPPSLTSSSPVPSYLQQGDAIMNRYAQCVAPSIASTASAGDVSLVLGNEFQQDPSA